MTDSSQSPHQSQVDDAVIMSTAKEFTGTAVNGSSRFGGESNPSKTFRLNTKETGSTVCSSSASSTSSETSSSSAERNHEDGEPLKKKKKLLTSAPPPLSTVTLVCLFSCYWLYHLPTWEHIDEIATVSTFTHRIFPSYVTVRQMATIRLVVAAIIWAVSVQVVTSQQPRDLQTVYLPGSKLHPTVINMQGWRTMCTVTSMWWFLLGWSFSLSGYIAWQAANAHDDVVAISPWTLRAGILMWLFTAPNTLLVSSIVRYLIWPQTKKAGTSASLQTIPALLQHNLNICASMTEAALLGGLPIRWSEHGSLCLVGVAYLVFMWLSCCSWVNVQKHGPQFIYFFIDTTLPGPIPSLVLLGVLAVSTATFVFFEGLPRILAALVPFVRSDDDDDDARQFLCHLAFAVGVCSIVVRFRD